MSVPNAVRNATAPVERAQSEELADGLSFMGGGIYNSLAVEFRDLATVIEAPLNEERSLALINEVSQLIPNKPIRHVVNTHHHFDHSGGLHTYLAQGATIVTHEGDKDYYERVLFSTASRTLQPDTFCTYYSYFSGRRRPLPIATANQKYVISDDLRTIDLYPLQGLNHAADMLLVYLPKEKILSQHRLVLTACAVAQHVPNHSQPGPGDQFAAFVGGAREIKRRP